VETLLDTAAASEWLMAHGVRRTPATLRKLRCIGGGPCYRVLNGKPFYTGSDLIAWIEERLSPPRRNSAESGVQAVGSAAGASAPRGRSQ
jgi:hypothetical protein